MKEQPQQEHSFDAKDCQLKVRKKNLVQTLLHMWTIMNVTHRGLIQAQLCCSSTSCGQGRVSLGPACTEHHFREAGGTSATHPHSGGQKGGVTAQLYAQDTHASAENLVTSPLSTSGSKTSPPYDITYPMVAENNALFWRSSTHSHEIFW